MNKETIVLGKVYECRPSSLNQAIEGKIITKNDGTCVVAVKKYNGTDHDEIMENEGQVELAYSDIYGPVSTQYFFS